MRPSEELDAAGYVSPREAREIAQRFIDCHFNNEGKERPRTSVPANPQRDDDLRLLAFINQAERLRATLDGIANHLRTWATASAAHAEEFSGPDERQAYTRTDVHRCRAATVDEAAMFVEARIRALGEPQREQRPKLSAERARAVLREYPDADLSAFDVGGDPDAIAAEEAGKSIAAIAEKLGADRG